MPSNKPLKLSPKQKEVIEALRKGCRIYESMRGKPGNVGTYSTMRYTDGKGIGGSVTSKTLLILSELKILLIEDGPRHRAIYSLTELGKTVIID